MTKNTSNSQMANKRLLVIDDEENMRHMLTSLLTKYGCQVDAAANGYEGLQFAGQKRYDFILCDLKMPQMNGMEFLEAFSGKDETTVIMMSAYGSIDTAVAAMKLGAYDYISKPFKPDEILHTIQKAAEREILKKENLRLKERIRKIEGKDEFGNMIARSQVMQAVFELAVKVAQYDTTVLICGESGTGKELVAKGIHFAGKRSTMPLIPVNCGGIPENLLESELFGYKKGAFTGADRDKKGLFAESDGGTIFLDEIGELPQALQVKLLRVLQENEIRPVGCSNIMKIDVRVIAATARNLEEEVRKGDFREDLFYRLNVLQIKIPALRERCEDIPLLIRYFIERYNQKLGKSIQDVSSDAMTLLLKHNWPGNVRELENVVERAVVLSDQAIIAPDHLPPDLGMRAEKELLGADFSGYSLKEAQRLFEQKLIPKALAATKGNRTKAASLLEISHPSLLSKMKAYHIEM